MVSGTRVVPLTPEQHFVAFAEFAEYELASGGPDPHMRYVGWMSRELPIAERAWHGCIYMAVYNTPTAEIIWRTWSWERMQREPEQLYPWLTTHWQGLTLRRERRAVRSPEKLARCLHSCARFLTQLFPQYRQLRGLSPTQAYEKLWLQATGIYGYGRYAGYKILEYLRRNCKLPIVVADIRPAGGWSPRETLCMLSPALEEQITPHRDDYASLFLSNRLVEQLHAQLLTVCALDLDNYLLEVLLCNYRQEVLTQWQYPGRSHDMELVHLQKVQAHFGTDYPTQFWAAREMVVPALHRGELDNRWDYERKELGAAFTKYGYTWTDLRYNFSMTRDLEHPVPQAQPEDPHALALEYLASPW